MRYLVTGCAGFIASTVTRQLLDAGHEVVGVDNLNDAYDVRLKHWRMKALEGREGFKFVRGDIGRRKDTESLFVGAPFDAVLNLAARAGVRQSLENPWIYVDTNTTGTLNLLEECRKSDTKRFLVASTSSLYGSHNPLPFSETANTELPLSPYAASKKGAESMSASYAHLYGINVAVPRYFTVYGPAGRPDMSVFRFIKWIAEGRPITLYGDGEQSRDFTYVEDIARGSILAANKVRGFQIINLGNDSPSTINELIGHIELLLGKRAVVERRPFHKADVKATWADITKAKSLLGWQPTISLEDGVERTVAWYNENKDWVKDVDTGED